MGDSASSSFNRPWLFTCFLLRSNHAAHIAQSLVARITQGCNTQAWSCRAAGIGPKNIEKHSCCQVIFKSMPPMWFHETEEIGCWESTRSHEYFKNLSYVCAIFQRPDLWEIIWRVGWVRPRLGRKQPASQCRKYAKVNGACADPRRVWAQTGFQEGWWAGCHSNPGSLGFSVWPSSLIPCRLFHLWLWHVKTYAFHEAVQGDAQDEPEELVTSSANSCSTAWSDSPQMNTNEVVFNSTVFWAISQEELSPTDQASSLGFFSLSRSKGPNSFAPKETQVARALLSHAMVSALVTDIREMLVPRNRVKDRTKNRIQRTE